MRETRTSGSMRRSRSDPRSLVGPAPYSTVIRYARQRLVHLPDWEVRCQTCELLVRHVAAVSCGG